MNRISLLCVFCVLSMTVTAHRSVRYRNYLEHTERRKDGVVFEKYDSFRSLLPSHPVRHLRRQSDGSAEEDAVPPVHIANDNKYYTFRFFPPGDSADRLWFELSDMIGSGAFVDDLGVDTTEVLGDSHRVYQVWKLKFSFPFYGHKLDLVGVTSGGFLYTGTIFHEQVYRTQYIAPLMADFNPSLTMSGRVLVYSTEERFTVQWDQVLNHDHESVGPFTFQVSIFPSGKIDFAYRKLSHLWNELNNDDHPVEIGIADATYFETPGGLVLVVEYSRVSASDLLTNESTDLSYSAFEIDPIPNCVLADSCDFCMAITEQGTFNCSWCEAARQKCSDGVDRFTQDWFNSGCFTDAVFTCPLPSVSPAWTSTSTHSSSASQSDAAVSLPSPSSSSLSTASVVGIVIGAIVFLLLLLTVILVGILIIHGYRRPTSKIGMFMIENRPKAFIYKSEDCQHT